MTTAQETPDAEFASSLAFRAAIAVEKNVQALLDAVEHHDESWQAVIIGPQYVPLERQGPLIWLVPIP